MEPLPDDVRLIGPEELATLLGRSAAAIRTDCSRRPEVLPPRFLISTGRKSAMRWRLSDVRAWMDRISQESIERAEAEQAERAKAIAWRPPGWRI